MLTAFDDTGEMDWSVIFRGIAAGMIEEGPSSIVKSIREVVELERERDNDFNIGNELVNDWFN